MNATPRVRSGAFPQSPATVRAGRGAPPTPSPSPPAEARDRAYAGPRPLFASARPPRSAIPGIDGVSRSAAATAAAPPPARPGPLISVDLLDAPTQRLYVLAIYAVLLSWKIYDWVQLIEDNAESFWIFAKWIGIDFAFLFGLPELRIPWLELSQPAAIVFFLGHVAMNYMLMFNVGLPLHAWVLAIAKVFYDRELSISEHYVKTSSILHNASLISGRQIINILPEGSAVLNPDSLPFCISGGSNNAWGPTTAVLPLYFNATVPAEVELIRIDLDTNEEETLRLTKSQLRDIAKLVKRQEAAATDDDTPTAAVRFDVPVKKTGAYRLGRVLDEYKLDVQRSSPLSFVVACPAARVRSSGQTKPLLWSQGTPGPVMRCHGDLSNLWVEVDGTPPLKIVYSRTINGKDHSFHFQSLQPEGFVSPLLGTRPVRMPGSAALTNHDATDAAAAADALDLPSEEYADISWARSRSVPVGFNESMLVGGEWKYSIDEVHDAFGNVIKYNDPAAEDADQGHPRASSAKHLVQSFLVRDRPRIRFKGCDLREPLKVAQGRFAALPIHYDMPGQRDPHERSTHTVTYQFSPLDSLTNSGDHGDVVSTEIFQARFVGSQPWLSEPGLYTLKSVSADSCEGAVLEPAACLLLNPPKPTLSLRAESIPDSCGNSNIGMRVHLDLVGTPPFIVRYEINSDGGKWTHERVHISDMQYEMQLTPPSSGNHKYIFRSIGDAVYVDEPLSRGPEMTLEQTVKAPPSAGIVDGGDKVVCLEEAVEADVALGGDPPFTLEYALIRDGSRQPFKAEHITGNRVHIATPVLSEGGEYLLTLTSILDSSGCRTMLKGDKSEMRISVRRQPPRAAFGLLEGRRRVLAVEDAEVLLPLRLTGGEPWEITYRKLDDGGRAAAGDEVKKQLWSGNGAIGVSKRGTYEITSVRDSKCPGVVDASASTFEVDWFPRPQMSFVPTDGIREQDGNVFVKKDVCEGDVDGFEIDLKGGLLRAPFNCPLLLTTTNVQAPLPITSSMMSATSQTKARAHSSTSSSTPRSAASPFRWTPARPARTATSLRPRPTACITTCLARASRKQEDVAVQRRGQGRRRRWCCSRRSLRSRRPCLARRASRSNTARSSRTTRSASPWC